jgi:hypothetical protein
VPADVGSVKEDRMNNNDTLRDDRGWRPLERDVLPPLLEVGVSSTRYSTSR